MNFKITNILLLFILFTSCNTTTTDPPEYVTGNGLIYYLSSSGDDSSDGLSETTPIKTISRLNDITLNPGDNVLFRRGDEFRGYPIVQEGDETAWIKYGSYGEGDRPKIIGSVDVNREDLWVLSEESNIWHYTIESNIAEVGALYLGVDQFGSKKWAMEDLQNSGDFYFNNSDRYLYIYSTQNPALEYDEFEAALTLHIFDLDNVSHILLEELHITRGAAHGVAASNVSNIIIRDCEISFVGGGELSGGSDLVRFGNGIEFWTGASNILVERNYIHDIYDTAVTNQGHSSTSSQRNIHYRNNLLINCGLASFELWLRPDSSEMKDIFFTNNTSINPGIGWGSDRPDKNSFHVASYGSLAESNNLVIENNLFYNSVEPEGVDYIENFALFFYLDNSESLIDQFSINNNLWYKEHPLWTLHSSDYTNLDWEEWRTYTGHSKDGYFIEPTFSDSSTGDYTLTGEFSDIGYSF